MHITRRKTRQIKIGKLKIGGDAPVSVQSMCSTDTRDTAATIEQIRQLEAAGCEVIRVAVPDDEAAAVLPKIKAAMTVPLIADIHFDHRLALKAAEIVDCVRINPGNIGAWWKVEEVIKAVNERGIPLRVGVNGGSLERPLLDKYGWPSPEALAESALNAVHALEDVGFTNMKVSLKASNVTLIAAPVLLMALDAYHLSLNGQAAPVLDGFSGDQRFFIAAGQAWRKKTRDEALKQQLASDPHSPGEFRTNGTVGNMPEFQKAFSCKAGSPMVHSNACRVW